MHAFPHLYRVKAAGRVAGDVELSGDQLPMLPSAPPVEFGGPGDRWSPETLLVAAVADCFVLTFRAVAKASKVDWISLDCDVRGTLDRVDHVTQFTRFDIAVHLAVGAGQDIDRARHALEKSKRNCLITSSLKAAVGLEAIVDGSDGQRQASIALADGQGTAGRES